MVYRKIIDSYDYSSITIHLFSYYENKLNLEPILNHFIDKCDLLVIYLNGYENDKPNLPKTSKIKVIYTKYRDDMSNYKSYNGYQLFISDKYIYPQYYVENMINDINKYNKKYVVGYDGKLFKENARTLEDVFVNYKVDIYVDQDKEVHYLEHDLLGFYTKSFRITSSDLRFQNMIGLWIALQGQLQKVPFICLKHSKDYILKMNYGKNMYEETPLHKITKTNKEYISKSVFSNITFKIMNILPI